MKNADFNLNEGESGSISNGQVICSGGLGPCIAVGLFDKKSKIGYMIHESNADNNDTIIVFINGILEQSSRNELKVCVAGGDTNGDEFANESVENDRIAIREVLLEHFDESQISFNWNNGHYRTMELCLDSSSEEFSIYVEEELGSWNLLKIL